MKLLLDTDLLNFASRCYALWRFALVGMVVKLARKARPITGRTLISLKARDSSSQHSMRRV